MTDDAVFGLLRIELLLGLNVIDVYTLKRRTSKVKLTITVSASSPPLSITVATIKSGTLFVGSTFFDEQSSKHRIQQ
jgi:hypothetical protein